MWTSILENVTMKNIIIQILSFCSVLSQTKLLATACLPLALFNRQNVNLYENVTQIHLDSESGILNCLEACDADPECRSILVEKLESSFGFTNRCYIENGTGNVTIEPGPNIRVLNKKQKVDSDNGHKQKESCAMCSEEAGSLAFPEEPPNNNDPFKGLSNRTTDGTTSGNKSIDVTTEGLIQNSTDAGLTNYNSTAVRSVNQHVNQTLNQTDSTKRAQIQNSTGNNYTDAGFNNYNSTAVRPVNQAVNQTLHQAVNEAVNEAVNQTVNQTDLKKRSQTTSNNVSKSFNYTLTASTAAITTPTTTTTTGAPCPPPFHRITTRGLRGSCYFVPPDLLSARKSFDGAEAACQSLSSRSHLVHTETLEEMEGIQNYLETHHSTVKRIWIGGKDENSDNTMRWIGTGVEIPEEADFWYFLYEDGSDYRYHDYDCAYMYHSNLFLWPCEDDNLPFICELL